MSIFQNYSVLKIPEHWVKVITLRGNLQSSDNRIDKTKRYNKEHIIITKCIHKL